MLYTTYYELKILRYPIPKAIIEEWKKVEMLIDHL